LTFEDLMMIEAGPGDGEKDPSAAPTRPRHDFSLVQGFQVVGADHHAAGQNAGGDDGWRDALKLELETRSARFHHAVDSAIVLSNDGVIRWLGDPVARLSPGPGVLTPGVVILADEALPDTARDIVKARIELWLAATMRRILGPLFALDALQEGSEVVRDLAGRLAKTLGILEREPIRGQLKALAQNDRAELRKVGVRFGAYYVFVPALIKPAARTLALQLWSLQAPGDAGALLAALAQVASSGRTSLLLDKEISREGYRVAGYRPCGERIVRVDVIERLAGIIRGAIVESQARGALGAAGHGRSIGFVVSGQMTSLTGCAGEQFASILRSIGFRSVEMKRSEFIGSPPAFESPQQREPPPQTENPEIAADGRASPAIGGEAEAPVDVFSASPEAPSADETLLDIAQSVIPLDALCSDVSRAEPGAAPPASATSSEEEKKAEMIVVWRPDNSAPSRRGTSDRIRRNRDQAQKSERLAIGPLDRPDNAGRSPAAAPKGKRNKSSRTELRLNLAPPDDRNAATRPPGSVGRRETVRFDEKHRQTPSDRDMPPSHPASERQARAKVDPNSPFAKLLELRPLLEGQANKRP
jgi:ATP-dependent RNA helicase SUPV3L1/SUV3